MSCSVFVLGCTFLNGDGIGGTEIRIGYQKGSACIDACLQRKRTDDSINGVTTLTDAPEGGCWCKKGMHGRNNKTKYKSCYGGNGGKALLSPK